MLNSCILTGNLGADPEIFYSSEGEPVATFNLAFRSSKKKTGWIKITCFQRLAETAERYLHKGARIVGLPPVLVPLVKLDPRAYCPYLM